MVRALWVSRKSPGKWLNYYGRNHAVVRSRYIITSFLTKSPAQSSASSLANSRSNAKNQTHRQQPIPRDSLRLDKFMKWNEASNKQMISSNPAKKGRCYGTTKYDDEISSPVRNFVKIAQLDRIQILKT
jgi:hypothetical protein